MILAHRSEPGIVSATPKWEIPRSEDVRSITMLHHHASSSPAHKTYRPKATGFTLVELLVVIAIIGILVALLLPAIQSAREAARRMQCTNNLKQVGLALQSYHGANKTLPHGANYNGAGVGGTWAALILPYIEEQNVYDLFDFDKKIWDPVNRVAVRTIIPGYICPSDDVETPLLGGRLQVGRNNPGKSMGLWYPTSMGPTRDGVNSNDSCVFCPENVGSYCCADTSNFGCCQRIVKNQPGLIVPGAGVMDRSSVNVEFREISDGLSNTFLAGETLPEQCIFNGAYNHNNPINGTTIPLNTFVEKKQFDVWYRACGFKSRHHDGASFVMCDGSVHFLSESIDYRVYNEMGSRAGGEIMGPLQ